MSALHILATEVLAAGGESRKSGPLGLVVILALCVLCYFLFKSMSTHLRKVREEFPVDGRADTNGAADAPDAAEPTQPPPPADAPPPGGDA